ncbi:MAG: PrsW family intramembrane metalloprotease [Candidatus Portnoybacteria bacterium]
MILKVFIFGMLATIPVVLAEMGIEQFLKSNLTPFLFPVINAFLGVALIEEFGKFLVVKGKVLKNIEFDEPLDAMLYMIIAALGFAAAENILILFGLGPKFMLTDTVSLTVLRFLGATFLHTLSSGILGYFLAFSICETKKRGRFLLAGIALATFLHGLYNFSIMELDSGLNFLIPIAVLLGTAAFFSYAFKRLKALKSVCKI